MQEIKNTIKLLLVPLLLLEARLIVKKYRPHVIAITGSVGKTSTKDAIHTVVSDSLYARKSEKSFNSEIGIPLTILGVPNAWSNPVQWLKNLWEGIELLVLPNHYPKWLVLEVGVDRPGDIERIVKWLPIDVAVFTRLPDVPVHVEYFDSPEAVGEEKLKLLNGLKRDGVIVYNGDDPILRAKLEGRKEKKITYGLADADVTAGDYKISDERGLPTGIEAVIDGERVFLKDVIGKQQLYVLLAAFAVGKALEIEKDKIAKAFEKHAVPPGRMHLIRGVKGTIIIDDTYNSSPIAAEEALVAISEVPASRKIVVLGDMLELGAHSMDEHKKIGKVVKGIADLLVTVGIRSKATAESANKARMKKKDIKEYMRSEEVGRDLREILEEGDLVLVKGSQSMRMEKIVANLMAEPERAKELLVRQESYWMRR